MSNFALSVNSPYQNVVQSLNYALATLNTGGASGNVTISGNVLQTSGNGAVFNSNVGVLSYVNTYVDVAYANTATGGGFSSNSTDAQYFGVYNTTSDVWSTNPSNYTWTQVSGGFGTTKSLFYTTAGGGTINFFAGTSAPSQYYYSVPDSTPINLQSLANNIVSTTNIQEGAVTGVSIAANTITAYNIQVGSLYANLFAAGQIIVGNSIQSENATFGNTSSQGFWLDAVTGNVLFNGQTNIGSNLVVANDAVIGSNLSIGQNATIGANLSVQGLITEGNLGNSVVTTQTIASSAVNDASSFVSRPGTNLVGYVPNSSARNLWPNNTRGIAVTGQATGSGPTPIQGNVIVNYSTTIYSDNSAATPYNLVELWKETGTITTSYDASLRKVTKMYTYPEYTPDNSIFIAAGINGQILQANITGIYGPPLQTDTTFTTIANLFSSSHNYNSLVARGNAFTDTDNYVANIYPVSTTTSPAFTAYDVCYMPWGTSGTSSGPYPTLVVGSSGIIMRTTDSNLTTGTVEANYASNTADVIGLNDLYGVACSANVTVNGSTAFTAMAVGAAGAMLYDASRVYTNGVYTSSIGWVVVTPANFNQNLNAVYYNVDESTTSLQQYMAVGNKGAVITYSIYTDVSLLQNTGVSVNLRGVTYDNIHKNWLVCGDNGTILYSSDGGVTWNGIATGITNNLYSIAYMNGAWVAVGDGITLMGSNTSINLYPLISHNLTQTWGDTVSSINIQRVTFAGSYPWIGNTSPMPPASQQIGNQSISGQYIDYDAAGEGSVYYFLVVGNLAGNANIYVTNPSMTVTVQKR